MNAYITPELAEVIWNEAMFGMAIINQEGIILDANPKLCELLGYTRSGLINKSFHDITHPDDYEMDNAEFTRLKAGDIEKYGMFKRYITKDGHIIGLKLKVVAVRKDGNLELVLGQVSDDIQIIPLSEPEIKKITNEALGKFIIEHWKIVVGALLVIAGVVNAPDIVKLIFGH